MLDSTLHCIFVFAWAQCVQSNRKLGLPIIVKIYAPKFQQPKILAETEKINFSVSKYFWRAKILVG